MKSLKMVNVMLEHIENETPSTMIANILRTLSFVPNAVIGLSLCNDHIVIGVIWCLLYTMVAVLFLIGSLCKKIEKRQILYTTGYGVWIGALVMLKLALFLVIQPNDYSIHVQGSLSLVLFAMIVPPILQYRRCKWMVFGDDVGKEKMLLRLLKEDQNYHRGCILNLSVLALQVVGAWVWLAYDQLFPSFWTSIMPSAMCVSDRVVLSFLKMQVLKVTRS